MIQEPCQRKSHHRRIIYHFRPDYLVNNLSKIWTGAIMNDIKIKGMTPIEKQAIHNNRLAVDEEMSAASRGNGKAWKWP